LATVVVGVIKKERKLIQEYRKKKDGNGLKKRWQAGTIL